MPLPRVAVLLALAAAALLPWRALSAAPALVETDAAGLKQAVAAQKGKLVLLFFFATWCEPCMEELPRMLKLQPAYADRGLAVIAASVDDPKDRPKVRDWVEANKPGFPVFIRRSGGTRTFTRAIDPKWRGAIPAVYYFDRKGQQLGAARIGGQSYDQLKDEVETLLSRP